MVMSNETSTRAQKREKSATGGGSGGKQTTHKIPQATAEQMRIAQLVSDQKDDDISVSNVLQIIEVTGTSEENALMALYDSSNDPTRAIELILEKGTLIKDDGWETAGRKKNRGGSSMTRGIDTFEDEPKEEKSNENKRDWNETGRGRGSRRGKGRNQDRSRTHDDNDKENENLQDRGKDGRRGGGRGRGRSGPSRGRGGRGRGAPRHSKFNSNFGGKYGEDSSSFNSKDTLTEPVDMWKGTTTECWDIEVGTWSSEDAKKQQTKKEKPDEGFSWGTESWNDDLSESKVFQAQNIQLPVQSLSGENSDRGGGNLTIQNAGGDMQPISNHYQNTTPQTGERIDLGMLFKKSGNSSLRTSDNSSGYGNAGNIGYGSSTQNHSIQQHTTPDVIQQLQQHGQSNSLFSESSASATSVTSRLFSEYDRPQHQTQSAQDSLFKTGTDAQSSVESSYSQLNGTVGQLNNQSKSSSSSFLDSFSGLSSNTAHQPQSAMLGQLSDLSSKQTSMSNYSQVRQQPDVSSVGNRGLNGFSQGQQKQATDAVKASLGIPIGENSSGIQQQHSSHGNTQVQSGQMPLQNQIKDEAHLSFGSPLPPQMHQQSKQQRKKIPSMPSKIPASAVEMPGNNSYNTQEYVNFSLQFGADDSAPPMEPNLSSTEYGVTMPHSGTANMMAQRSLFLNNDVPAEQSSSNRLSSNVTDSSLFTQASPQMTPTKSEMQRSQENAMLPNQRIGEAVTSSLDQPTRAPPGLSMPNPESSALSSLAGGGSGGHVGGNRLGADISSLYKGSNEHDMNSGRSLETSLGQVQSLSSSFSQVHHSYYSSTSSSGNQSQQQDISNSVGRNLHTPDASSSLPGSLQSSPMPQSKLMQRSGNTPVKDPSTNMEPSSTPHSNISSLATSLSQVSMPSGGQHHHHGTGTSVMNQSSMLSAALTTSSAALPYSSTLSSSGNRGLTDQNTASSIGKGGYDTSQDSLASFNSYTSTPSNVAAVSTIQSQQSGLSQSQSTITTNAGMHGSAFSSQSSSTLSSTTLGGFATAKMPHPMSNKAPLNIPPGVTTPILQSQYGIPMAGLMPYAPDISYGYDQLLLAQSRVINPLSYYDMHYHNNTHNATVNGRDSNAALGQASTGQGKYNREPSSPTPSAAQLPLSGSMGSNLSQHNSSVSQQNTQMKAGSQSAGHHSAQQQQQQQFVGAALPAAYAGYSSLAAPYYGGMPGFQYPPTMFAAAMHQAPKHSVNTTTGFQQPSTGFNHSYSSASITSSSGLQDLQGSNYSKTHASAFEKQQGYHQHANTPPPFNIQAINAAVAAGGGATTGGGAPGLGPYTTPYMAMLQPHQSQQQAIHLLQQQHQDATGGQPIGSQRNLGSNSLVKSVNKQSAYGASGYWGN